MRMTVYTSALLECKYFLRTHLLDLFLYFSYIHTMNDIKWKVKASRQLQKIKDDGVRKTIYLAVQELSAFPSCANVKKLTNHIPPYRLRVGNHRVFFSFEGEISIVFIEEVRKRDERTY